MKSKPLNFVIPLVLFPFDIMVSVSQNDAQFRKSLMGHMPPDCVKDLEDDPKILSLGYSTDGRTINFSTGHQTVIRLKKHPKTAKDHGVVAHEIFHAVSFILWRMGVNLEIEKTDEVFAYAIGYVTEEIYKKI